MVNRLLNPRLQNVTSVASRSHVRPISGSIAWMFVVICLLIDCGHASAQQWTLLPQNNLAISGTNPTGATSTMLLLPNGSVMVHGVGQTGSTIDMRVSNQWFLLSPDNSGNYATGSWSSLSNMNASRYGFGSWVLPNGNVVIAGGQYESFGNYYYYIYSDLEIYSTLTGAWRQSATNYPSLNFFLYNPPSVLLGTNNILFGDIGSDSTYLYNPASDSWAITGTKGSFQGGPNGKPYTDRTNDGQSFTLLSNGKVLTWPCDLNLQLNNKVPPKWTTSTIKNVGDAVRNGANFYVCTATTTIPPQTNAGLTAPFGPGPQGNSSSITDYEVTWSYLAPWAASTAYATGQTIFANGFTYVCTLGGTSSALGVGPSAAGVVNDGTITWKSLGTFLAPAGQLYNPNSGSWLTTSATTADVVAVNPNLFYSGLNFGQADEYLLGPASVMPDGSVIQFGGNGTSAIYQQNGTWTAGPTFPGGKGPDQAPGAMLPNGKFMIAADATPTQGAPTVLYLYDYTTQSLAPVPNLPLALAADLQNASAQIRRMLVLPNGHLLLNTGTGNVWDYNPGGAAQSSWAPTISSAPVRSSTSVYTLTGSRFTGICAGACYGPNATPATNYPIVQLTNQKTGVVRYATSSQWKPGISDPGSAATQTITFQMPSGFGVGTYSLVVIANGIPSSPVTFTVPVPRENYVTVAYNPANQIVTLTGDSDSNVVSMSLSNQVLTITGSGPVGGTGATLVRATETGTWSANTTSVTMTFANPLILPGMAVIGTGIPPGTTVQAVNGTALTLSQKTTAKSDPPTTQIAAWTSGSSAVTLNTPNPLIVVGMSVTGQGIAVDTTVAAVSGTSLTLSQNAITSGNGLLTFDGATLAFEQTTTTQSATWTGGATTLTLSAANNKILPGMSVNSAGFPVGTTVSAVSGTMVTVTNPANPAPAKGSGTVAFGGQSQQIHFGTNVNLATALTINSALNDGDDYLALTGISMKNVTATFGNGNDTFTIALCNIILLNADGGTGTNSFGYVASKIYNGVNNNNNTGVNNVNNFQIFIQPQYIFIP